MPEHCSMPDWSFLVHLVLEDMVTSDNTVLPEVMEEVIRLSAEEISVSGWKQVSSNVPKLKVHFRVYSSTPMIQYIVSTKD